MVTSEKYNELHLIKKSQQNPKAVAALLVIVSVFTMNPLGIQPAGTGLLKEGFLLNPLYSIR